MYVSFIRNFIMENVEKKPLGLFSHGHSHVVTEECSKALYCRLCGSVGSKMFAIFSEDGEKRELLEKILRCVPIIIQPSDTLPLNVCEKCCHKLDISYDLVITALNADIFLKAKYNIQEDQLCLVKQESSDALDTDESEEICDPSDQVMFGISVSDDGNVQVIKKKVTEKNSKSGYSDKTNLQRILESDEEDTNDEVLPVLNINGPAVCDICNSEFSDMNDFDDHVSTEHLLKHKWQCHACDDSFRESAELFNHKVVEHSGDVVSCNKCTSAKPIGAELNRFDCVFCDANFESKDALNIHSCDSNPVENTSAYFSRCRACGEVFPNNDSFNVHIKLLQSSSLILRCKVCLRRFCDSRKLQMHMKVHNTEHRNHFKCKVCNSAFRDDHSLNKHFQLHTGVKPHMCDLCGRMYNKYATMIKHRKLHKPINLWEFKCNQCDKHFETLKDMKAHVERAHDIAKVPEVSSEADNGKSQNRRNTFRWVCRFCGKRISTKLSLQDHERIHTGLKPFVCEWCGREFRSRPNLLQHHLTHTGDRKHSCNVCGKRFARKSFIAQHMRVHTGEKPYECNVCGHRFTQAGDMRRHRKRHSEVKPGQSDVKRVDLQPTVPKLKVK